MYKYDLIGNIRFIVGVIIVIHGHTFTIVGYVSAWIVGSFAFERRLVGLLTSTSRYS